MVECFKRKSTDIAKILLVLLLVTQFSIPAFAKEYTSLNSESTEKIDASQNDEDKTSIAESLDADLAQNIIANETTKPKVNDYLEENIDGEILAPNIDTAELSNNEQILDSLKSKNILDDIFSWLNIAKDETLADSGHTLYIKYTLFDKNMLTESQTLDEVFQQENWTDILLGQYEICADLLDPGDKSDYYIAFADTHVLNESVNICDHVFCELNNDGVCIDSPVLDYSTGIAYVPKSIYRNDNMEEIPYALQCQIMLATTLDANDVDIDLRIENNDPDIVALADCTISGRLFDVTVSCPITSPIYNYRLTLDRLKVYINGSSTPITLKDGTNASFDQGILELFFAPINLFCIDIVIEKPSPLSIINPPAYAVTSSSALGYVPDLIFDELDFDTLKVGSAFTYTAEVGYWWPNVADGDYMWQACVNSGKYCYSWISDPDSLYEYVAWTEGANWQGVSSRDLSSFTVSSNSSEASRNYFNYAFHFFGSYLGGQSWHSDRWPIFCNWDSGQWGCHLGLQCSHASNPVGTSPGSDHLGTIKVRVLDINLENAKPYIILAFTAPAIASQPGVGIYKFAVEAKGQIEINKTSELPDISNNNRMYSFQNIAYDIYADSACNSYLGNIKLNDSGYGISSGLLSNTYYVRENANSCATSGYAVDPNIYSIEVSAGKISTINVSDTPKSSKVDLLLQKYDYDLAKNTPQGCATLKDALFKISYFDEILIDDPKILESKTPKRSWTFATDEFGKIKLDKSYLASGEDLFTNSLGDPCLPIGSISIEEVCPPNGYLLNAQDIRIINIVNGSNNETIDNYNAPTIYNNVIRGGIQIEKRDLESKLNSPLGAAVLDGTIFTIISKNDQSVVVEGIEYKKDERITDIITLGSIAKTSNDLLPYGDYAYREVHASQGYNLTDVNEHPFSIRENNEIVCLSNTEQAYNQVNRGDIEFVKVRSDTQERLANIPFQITSKTTGESHIVVTDSNGQINTQSKHNKHTANTNANDLAMSENGTLNENLLDANAGVWFGKTEQEWMVSPNDSLGALPYDTYDIKELKCSNNKKLELVEIKDISINKHDLLIDIGTITNFPKTPINISTSARGVSDLTKDIFAEENAKITDRIEYSGLVIGTKYKFFGTLYDAATEQPLHDSKGQVINAEHEFVAQEHNGFQDLEFILDSTNLVGKKIVCFEQLYDLDENELVATHEDINDANQTVEVLNPLLNTYATDISDGDKFVTEGQTTSIIDTVFYKNVASNKTYTFKGVLMNKSTDNTGQVKAEPLLTLDGNPITSIKEFTAVDSTGVMTVEFELDTANVQPFDQIVVFETLTSDGLEYVSHADPNNSAETITRAYPTIETQTRDGSDGDQYILATDNSSFTDVVTYANLVPELTYTLVATVVDVVKDSDGQIASALEIEDAQGCPIVRSVSFVPKTSNGVQEVSFDFDATPYVNHTLVCYENLLQEDEVVATHTDPLSESQSIFPYKIVETSNLGKTLPQTSDSTRQYKLIAIIAISSLFICIYLFARYRFAASRAEASTSRSCSIDDTDSF